MAVFSLSKNIKNMKNLIASSILLDLKISKELTKSEIVNYFWLLGIRKLIIIKVVKGESEELFTRIGNSPTSDIGIFTTSYIKLFRNNLLRDQVLNNTQLSNKIVFLFEDSSWNEIVSIFRFNNILISGGSSSKRHLLSPLQLRLSRILLPLELNRSYNLSKTINDSFHSNSMDIYGTAEDLTSEEAENKYQEVKPKLNETIERIALKLQKENHDKISNNIFDNKASEVDKNMSDKLNNKENINKKNNHDGGALHSFNNLNSPFCVNNIQKRQYHDSVSSLRNWGSSATSAKGEGLIRLNDIKETNKGERGSENKDYQIFSYLEEVSKIVEDNQDNLFAAQKQIETLWISMMKNKLEDSKFLNHRLVKLLSIAKETLNVYSNHYTIKKRFPSLYKKLNKIEYLMLTFSLVLTYHSRVGHTSLSMITGNGIVYLMYKEIIKKQARSLLKETNKGGSENKDLDIENLTTYKQFKESLDLNQEKILRLGAFFIDMLSIFPANIFERSIHFDESKYGELAILTINSEHLEDIKKNIIIPPSSLPMICEPNQWSDNLHGGFLENKFEQKSIITGSFQHKHTVENKLNLYKAVNYLNSIKFGVNVYLLNYLENEGNFLLDSENNQEIDKSEELQREITLKVARTFSNIPFYLSTHSDFRGRIYTQSFFLSYQSGDLSTALLRLWEGDKLSESGLRYLYIYGANVYNEENLNKKSYDERVEWVKNNYEKILKMEPTFISKAESRVIFAAFCLTMREIEKNPDALVYLPIFLDATCSGIQHFSALLKDFELGQHVNLKKQTDQDKVEDIYSEMIDPINKAINEYGKNNPEFIKLSLVKLSRKLLKAPIMTKLYNSTSFGMSQQLKSNLIKKKSELQNNENGVKKLRLKYEAPGKNGPVILNNLEIFKMGEIIHEQIFHLYPSLKSIYSYFIDMVKLMIILNIPVVWITPSGLKITQSYSRSTLNKVAINMGGKTRSMILREWTEKLDKIKQVQAVIPNIIHSLDATHLINLLNYADDNKFKPIITIHDCFGTHPNKLEELSFMVKKEFVLLYTQSNFLENFHDRIIQAIKDNQYIIYKDKEIGEQFVRINRKTYIIPQVPKLGSLDLQNILESKYMIS